MKIKYYILAGVFLIVAPLNAQRQDSDSTLTRTVVVEQEYNPSVLDATKLNVLPPVDEPQVSKKEVAYDTKFSPSYSFPQTNMPAFVGKESFAKAKPGYFRLGYGNYGNVDSRANYRFNLSEKDQLNLGLSLFGMNGKLDLLESGKWNAHYYKTSGGINYLHQFGKANLKLGGDFGLSNFNYQPEHLFNKQKFMNTSFLVGVETMNSDLPLQADVNMKFSHYSRQNDWVGSLLTKDNKENKLLTSANVFGLINDDSKVGVFFNMNNYFYNNDSIDNYTTADFNPYYEFNGDSWRLRLGAHMDFAFGFGKSVNVAPDVNLAYVFSDSYSFYATATGGRLANDFNRMEFTNPYASITNRLEDTYEQLNTSIGFKASPTTGLWLNFFGGYQNLKKDVFQQNPLITDENNLMIQELGQTNTSNFFGGATFSYSYKNLVDLTLSGIYRNWSVDDNVALLMKPMFDLNFRTVIRPISPLDIELGYRYIHRTESDLMERLDAVSNLHAEATFRLYKGASIFIKGDNLLNQKYQYFYNYPTEGINFVGGVKLLF